MNTELLNLLYIWGIFMAIITILFFIQYSLEKFTDTAHIIHIRSANSGSVSGNFAMGRYGVPTKVQAVNTPGPASPPCSNN